MTLPGITKAQAVAAMRRYDEVSSTWLAHFGLFMNREMAILSITASGHEATEERIQAVLKMAKDQFGSLSQGLADGKESGSAVEAVRRVQSSPSISTAQAQVAARFESRMTRNPHVRGRAGELSAGSQIAMVQEIAQVAGEKAIANGQKCQSKACATPTKPVKVNCQGCKVLWYCSDKCKNRDWKKGHGKECATMQKVIKEHLTPPLASEAPADGKKA